jgi:ribose transport system permease protein
MSGNVRRRLNFGFDRFSGLYLWALFIIVFGIAEPHTFLTLSTVDSVASSQSVAAMLGVALVIPLTAGAYDLSIGATANLTAIVVVWLQVNHHWAVWPAVIMSVLVGLVIGAINGFITVGLKVNSFITTLGMATVIGAVQAIVSGNDQPLPPTSTYWSGLTQHTVFGVQIIFLYLLVIAVIVWWAMDHTPGGRYLHAIGGNENAARLSGVRVGKWTWLALIASGGISGLAGVFFSSLSGPSLTFGPELLLPAFAAAFLGSTQLRPGRFNVWGTLLAIYILQTGVRGMELWTSVEWLNDMFNGVALIAAVAFAVWRQGKVRARAKGTAPELGSDPPAEPETSLESRSAGEDPVQRL